METQYLNLQVKNKYDAAQKYFEIISVINDLKLAKSETEFIAFTAIEGNITDPELRKKFCDIYKTSIATINNMVYKLKRMNIVHKKGKLLFINPVLTKLLFNGPVVLQIGINQKQEIDESV